MTTTPSNAPQTDIHTAADSSSPLSVTLGTTTVTFTEWLPSSAPLSGPIIAADTETTRIDKANPWMTPTIPHLPIYRMRQEFSRE